MMKTQVRKARAQDAAAIQALINAFADEGKMLFRTLPEIFLNLRDFHVVEQDHQIVGCAALHLFDEQYAELKSIAVDAACQGKGYGRLLIESCLHEALALGAQHVFALTFQPEFFEKVGFQAISRDALPSHIWTECLFCPGYPDCGERAFLKTMT